MTHLKHAALGIAMIALAPLAGCGNDTITAQELADATSKRMIFPRDLGDGFRLESIAADGNAVVSTVTITDAALAADPRFVEIIQTATTSDICREIAPAKLTYEDAGITVAKVFQDASGKEIVRVDVRPADCK